MNAAQHFLVMHKEFEIKGDQLGVESNSNVLLLHGAGASHRGGFSLLRSSMMARDIGSTAFDFVGHGETGGEMAHSSLVSRSEQARAVVTARSLPQPLSLIGTSMGAYNAIKLAESVLVSSMVLIVPGIYTSDAYDIPFGPEFSSVIRRERSWAASDAWDILGKFTGRILIIAAEFDTVIPREIPERLFESAVNAQWRKLLIVEGAGHLRLFSLLQEQPERYAAALNLMLECIKQR